MMRKKKRDQNTFLYANKTLVMNLLADDVARHSEDKSANSIHISHRNTSKYRSQHVQSLSKIYNLNKQSKIQNRIETGERIRRLKYTYNMECNQENPYLRCPMVKCLRPNNSLQEAYKPTRQQLQELQQVISEKLSEEYPKMEQLGSFDEISEKVQDFLKKVNYFYELHSDSILRQQNTLDLYSRQ